MPGLLPDELEDALIETAGRIVTADDPGRAMRAARHRYGFTQAWLAEHLDLRRETLSRIESGHHAPSLDVVRGFSRLMTLAAGVRSHVAGLEVGGKTPDRGYIRRLGIALRIHPETVDAVVQEALANYEAKRATVLGHLGAETRDEPTRSMQS